MRSRSARPAARISATKSSSDEPNELQSSVWTGTTVRGPTMRTTSTPPAA
jgi:hypothetical protein